MYKAAMARLKDHILKLNPYFGQGFDDVVQDDTTGIVHNNAPVFPADGLGDYFYLRLPADVSFENSRMYQMSEEVQGLGLTVQVILVACMRDADPDQLLANLINTLQVYKTDAIAFKSGIYQSDRVLLQELAKVKSKENVDAALQRLDTDYTIVSLAFTMTTPFLFNNCIKTPCATC